MIYFGGGYPGLYWPGDMFVPPPPPPPSEIAVVVVEMPMLVVTGGTTRQAIVLVSAEQAMHLTTSLLLPMTRGMAERAEIPMRMITRGLVAPAVVTPFALPLPISTDWMSEPASVLAETEQPMDLASVFTVPMTRGMAEQAEIPMQMITHATVERS